MTTLAIHDVTVTEDSGSAVFRVSLSRESNEVVTVDYSTFDGTATAGLGLHGHECDADVRAGRDAADDRGDGAG